MSASERIWGLTSRTDIGETPFDRLGGEPGIRMLVDPFDDLMDGDDRFARLRAMHAQDFMPMREALALFLIS